MFIILRITEKYNKNVDFNIVKWYNNLNKSIQTGGNKMKKLISLILSGSMLMSSMCMASAESRTSTFTTALADASQIHILYNDTVVQYEDVKPVNTEGRVMIPFRAVLEDMGAVVEYDDANRLVTAAKGETEIKFTLMDDTIYVNDNGAESTITMDVPMIIVDGRTLVPIRFMSNALGMQVGWDGESETVIIMDYEDYFADLETKLPNFTKLTQLVTPEYNTEDVSLNMFLTAESDGEKVDATLSGDIGGVYVDGAVQLGVNLDVAVTAGEGIAINGLSLDLVFRDGDIFIKTNAGEKLSTMIDDAESKKELSQIKSDQWFKIDLKKVMNSLGLPEEVWTALETALESAKKQEKTSLKDALMSTVTTEGDASIDDAESMAMMIDMLEAMDKYIKIEEKANGGYSVSINISTLEAIDMIFGVIGEELSESDRKIADEMIDFYISAVTECDGKKTESNAKIVVAFDLSTDKLDFSLELTDKVTNDAKAKVEEIKDSTDITELVVALFAE